MRTPIAIKTHYPNGITLLDTKFKEVFSHDKGPGDLPVKKQSEDGVAKGIIVPHASYDLAGPAMAWSYARLAQHPLPDVMIIVAQAQKQIGSGLSMETFKTPYGEVRVDQHFARSLLEHKSISLNDKLHAQESLIEVQLPFLQFIAKPHVERLKILPIFVDETTDVSKLSVDIKETLLDQDKTASFVFVSNLTSYGRTFKYVPYTEDIHSNIYKGDTQLIQAIKAMDYEAFESVVNEHMMPISGLHAIRMMMAYFNKDTQVELEQYYLSAEINNDYSACVSFASFYVK